MKSIAFLVTLIGLAALLAPQTAFAEQPTPTPVILDVDLSLDDWMALLYMAQREDVNLLAVTVSGTGMATCDPGVQNAMNLLTLAGNPDILVACGSETPLKGTNTFPKDWRDIYNQMMGHELEANPNSPLEMTAVELLQQTLASADQPVTILALAPHTNLAELLQADPTAAEHIAHIYTMGGAFDVQGNVNIGGNTTAEWNTYADPLALAQVLESGIPMTFIPLDATNQTPLNLKFYRRLAADRTTPEAEFIYAILSDIAPYLSNGFYFWDQLAAVVMMDTSVATLEERTITVITDEGKEFGRTVTAPDGYPVQVAVNADAARFEQNFLNVLNGREPEAVQP